MSTATEESPLEGRCGARTRSRGRLRGALGDYCKQWPLAGEKRCRLHGGRGNTEKRGKQNKATMKHGLRSRFLDTEGATFYQAARADLDETSGADVLADMAAFLVAKIQVHARRCADEETLDGADALLRAQLTARHLIETRHRIVHDREGRGKGDDMTVNVVIPKLLMHDDERGEPIPAMVKHASGEQRRALIDPAGQLLIESPAGGWHQAIETMTDGEIRYTTSAELNQGKRRPLALLENLNGEDK